MLAGFKFLLGLGLFGGSQITEIVSNTNAYQMTDGQKKLLSEYRGYYNDLRCNKGLYPTDIGSYRDTVASFAPYTWPKYLYLNPYTPTRWKELAAVYDTTVDALQVEYFKWACKRDGVPFSRWLFDRVYLRYPTSIENHKFPSATYDPKVEAENRRRQEAMRAAKSAEEKAEEEAKRAYDEKILAKRRAMKENKQ